MKIEINEKEAVNLVATILAEKMLGRIDSWKLKQRVHQEIGEIVVKNIDFDKVMKESLKSYKRSVGNRLGQQADRNLYDMFVYQSKRIQKLELELDTLKEQLIKIDVSSREVKNAK